MTTVTLLLFFRVSPSIPQNTNTRPRAYLWLQVTQAHHQKPFQHPNIQHRLPTFATRQFVLDRQAAMQTVAITTERLILILKEKNKGEGSVWEGDQTGVIYAEISTQYSNLCGIIIPVNVAQATSWTKQSEVDAQHRHSRLAQLCLTVVQWSKSTVSSSSWSQTGLRVVLAINVTNETAVSQQTPSS